jgi:hypothetical protein
MIPGANTSEEKGSKHGRKMEKDINVGINNWERKFEQGN